MKNKNPMEKHIEAWKKSGSSIKSYCREHSIAYDKFQYWKYRNPELKYWYRAGEEIETFLPVSITENKRNSNLILEIEIEADGKMILRIGNKA